MTKILHTADVHLDSPLKSLALKDEGLRTRVMAATRTAFTRIVDTALSEQVAALLIAGDLFDGAERSARTAAFLTGELDRLRAANIRVYYIKGNHDADNPITGELSLPDNVHVFTGHGGKDELASDLWIHGVSFSGRHAPDSLLPKFAPPVEGAVNIAMLHTSLAGSEGHDTYAPCSVAELTAAGFDYWALGHVHKRQVHARSPWVIMPGCPQGRDIGEAGPRSASLLTITDGQIQVEEVPTSAVEFAALEIDVTGFASADAMRDLLRARLRDTAQSLTSDTGILRLTLTGHTDLHWQILRDRDVWQETIDKTAQDTGVLWLEKLSFDLKAPQTSGPSVSATDTLADLMAQITTEPGFADALHADMRALLDDLPATRRAVLLPDEDAARALATDLARNGAAGMLARMKGATD
ncbi:DNA repair exonuclease [Sagittula sp. NFXS13]|uniref:metallophosphoesterase family protein n=1 Tax=Sagittula sp. NFXS13 TaxID=2819095 RepID=UPI0032DF055C